MSTRRKLLQGLVAAPAILSSRRLRAAALIADDGLIGPSGVPLTPVTSVALGGVFPYSANASTNFIQADTFIGTWADDGLNYMMSCDSTAGWNAGSSSAPSGWNMGVSTLSTNDSSAVGTLVNRMTSWGGHGITGSDGATYKTTGLICVAGVLYATACRMIPPTSGTGWLQSISSSQIIKSTNHGVTWTPAPPSTANPYASPMFPSGTPFGGPNFINYGQNYSTGGVDNTSTYVYAIASTMWDNGNNYYLGRCTLANLPNLVATDWSWWVSGDGLNSANWTATPGSAGILITNTGKASVLSVQYFPGYGYVLFSFYYPTPPSSMTVGTFDTIWQIYYAALPWGPWSLIQTNEWNPQGYYNAAILPSSVSGANAVVAFAGNYYDFANRGSLYQLNLMSITLNGVVSTTTLDTVNKGTNQVLTGGNLTTFNSTNISGTHYNSCRSLTSKSTGKFYVEFMEINVPFAGAQGFGICNSTFALTGTNDAGGFGVGRDFNSCGYYDNGKVCINNVAVSTIATAGQSNIIGMAVDFGANLIWFRVGSNAAPGNWNNLAIGSANPATGIGGISLSTLNAGPYFVAIGQWIYNAPIAQGTVNFGAIGGYAYTPPAGFGPWT